MLIVSIFLGSIGQIMLKTGTKAGSTDAGAAAITAAVKLLGNPWVIAGFFCYGISSIIWLMILKRVPLSTAYPMISFSYVLVVILSAVILKEPIRWQTIAGMMFIMLGVSMIGLGMAKVGGK